MSPFPSGWPAAPSSSGSGMGITIRPLNMKDFEGEVERIKELYNAAWEKNWGFVPMTEHEIDHLAEQFKPVVIPELVPIAEKDGKVIGFGIALPDLNVVFRRNRSGRMFPMILKLLWALKTRKIRRARILLLGVLPEYRGKGVDAMLYHWIWTKSGERGIYWGEAGWILEDNPAMNAGLEKMTFKRLQDLPALRPADMKALVTGATGFVGSHLAEALRRRGDEVTALARSASKAAALEPLGVRVVPGDLHDRAALQRAVEGQDVVYHVAGVVAARGEADFLAANRDGTRHVVEAAERAGVGRLVLVSSMAAAGPTVRGHPLRGDEPPRPVTAYGRSKLAAEDVVTASRLPWTIVRPPMVYGPRDQEVLKVFRLARLGLAPVLGDGTQELSAVHGADLAEALVAAGTTGAAAGRIYYACHPEVFTSARDGARRGPARWASGPRSSGSPPSSAAACSWSRGPRPGWRGRPPSSRRTRPTSSSSRPGRAIRTPSLGTPAGAPAGISRPGWPRPTPGTGRRDGCSRSPA